MLAPANDKNDPTVTPGPHHSAPDVRLTPVPAGSSRRQRTLLLSTPKPTPSPFPLRTPRTPGNAALNPCTVDESLYAKVTVHTAKCTECDKRNMNTMRRCPGCTFQVCQPCYQRREREGKGLVHGNMPTPSGTLATSSGGRKARTKPVPSLLSARNLEKKIPGSNQEQNIVQMEIDPAPPASKSTKAKKRAMKKPRVEDSDVEESSGDEFEPDDASPTRSKFRRMNLSFAESALATALRTPPSTRAARRLNAAPVCEEPSPTTATAETFDHQITAHYTPPEHLRNDILYQQAIQGYNEPLLGRREPVLSNPVAHIPAIVQRGGQPRPSAEEIYGNIQAKLPEKLSKIKGLGVAENDACSFTVRACVEQEARKYQNGILIDEDENKALLHAMESAALLWGKKTYRKLDPAMQQMLRTGLNLRLDKIDGAYMDELRDLMAEHADRMLKELAGNDARSMSRPLPSGQ
ncbi:uncharacterized protein SETTUDRAFT_108172 [Exserohilum turcica Et28A]|uniref:Uncharacterized protein n=1 Tax=Exserohilum turcicum (strain 28A) TaxID=671987 RepID=R0K548_EXST2|nr:uncharacterized protein SETTUDRAFT_108172 [Exserohilum turcica Et28A]EOA88133.1 hypothetical protein SETTUDRAFT_108172 [Exserohilum turcica Et28A]